MLDLKTIYEGAANLINQVIRKESTAQGHNLTGAMEDSLTFEVSKSGKADVMEGFAVYYTRFVNDGVPAESASMAQFPFLVKYFELKGLGEKEAKGAAAATIHTWMKTGMSTPQSKAFSSTGSRQNFIENAFVGNEDKIDEYMGNNFDLGVEEEFQKEKSETI